jgi:nucleoside-diphosphate-sugar epimerase
VQVRADKCLIVNTKGGGHAFIGLYLAKELLAKGHDVTIFNDGDAVSKRSRGLRKV